MANGIDSSNRIGVIATPESVDRENSIIATYRIEGSRQKMQNVAAKLAMITTVGTLTPLPFEDKTKRNEQCGKVIRLLCTERVAYADIAYPIEICGISEGMPQLLGLLWYGSAYKYFGPIRLEDVQIPSRLASTFNGPRFGISGARNRFEVEARPIIGAVMKPRLGINLAKHSHICCEACKGGVDYIIDDELIVDPAQNEMKFEKRVPAICEAVQKTTEQTGEKKSYVVNVTSRPAKLRTLALKAIDSGADAIMVNPLTIGFSALESIACDEEIDVPIVANNIGSPFFTRSEALGIGENFLSKISRLGGADAVYTGVSAGEMWSPEETIRGEVLSLQNQWGNIKPCFAVSSGGITPLNLWRNMAIYGNDVMIQAGSGIHGLPSGSKNGAMVFRKIVENLRPDFTIEMARDTIDKIAEKNRTVREALNHYKYDPSKL